MDLAEKPAGDLPKARPSARAAARITLANSIRTATTSVRHTLAYRARVAPVSPIMMTPVAAWHHFCAKTGGSVSLMSFYRWIRNGRVFAVRVGKKCFIPVGLLEEVIKRCRAGDEF